MRSRNEIIEELYHYENILYREVKNEVNNITILNSGITITLIITFLTGFLGYSSESLIGIVSKRVFKDNVLFMFIFNTIYLISIIYFLNKLRKKLYAVKLETLLLSFVQKDIFYDFIVSKVFNNKNNITDDSIMEASKSNKDVLFSKSDFGSFITDEVEERFKIKSSIIIDEYLSRVKLSKMCIEDNLIETQEGYSLSIKGICKFQTKSVECMNHKI